VLGRVVAVALAGGLAYVLLIHGSGPGTIAASTVAAASEAGCADLERPVLANPSRDHLEPGEPPSNDDPPAAAGPHDPSPLEPDPHVRAEPLDEARAVHNLEHAYVLIYHAPETEGGPSAETIARLASVVEDQDRVLMAPYPGLPEGTGLAFVAWNTRWRCPGTIDPETAVEVATAFIDAYRGTTNAPEAPRGLLGPLLTG
jgi:hypothetical protein